MLLIEALPAKWDSLASAYMHENTKVKDYKFIDFHNVMCAEWERQSGKKVPHHADKLPSVKQKGKSSHFSKNLINRKLMIKEMTTATGNASTNTETIRVRKKLLTLITSTFTWPAVV
jgi:hypothetical protein